MVSTLGGTITPTGLYTFPASISNGRYLFNCGFWDETITQWIGPVAFSTTGCLLVHAYTGGASTETVTALNSPVAFVGSNVASCISAFVVDVVSPSATVQFTVGGGIIINPGGTATTPSASFLSVVNVPPTYVAS